ncbi:hypothetical protein [Amycolatopsis keratiniphila]|uniref:golvesin C-terminal-like domain-containing protein n=1 Tax=Amycolatopsis keratiniphila TaxID=129921 RepID=UPI00130114BE|nr:hypothetical protein [Amycolatopsis keratiniphila]
MSSVAMTTPDAVSSGTEQAPASPAPSIRPAAVDLAQRNDLLGPGWKTSQDRLWTTSGDANGFHVLVAEAKTGYSWRTAATLRQPGLEADQWIGNACITGSGDRAVVVYAPRTFTNKEKLTSRGGFTAIVDLVSGAITQLPVRTSLAYYNPGCGAGETAALTQEATEDLGKTGVLLADAASGKVGSRKELAGQVTSALPVPDGFVVADSKGLLKVADDGKSTRLVANTAGVPFAVKADGDRGIVFMDQTRDATRIFRAVTEGSGKKAQVHQLASGKRGALGLSSGSGGRLFITGAADSLTQLPPSISKVDAPVSASVSTLGEAVAEVVRTTPSSPDASTPELVHIEARSARTGKALAFTVNPGETLKPRWTDPRDPARTCAVPRNSTGRQVYQPKPKQVEWAANMAVKGQLSITRPANWRGNGLGAYVPQQLFRSIETGGDVQVPAQILLGILGQESNLWQASRHTLPGEVGNPLIGNYYGLAIYDEPTTNDWDIRWDRADCGYGVSQLTDGMRLAGHARPDEQLLPADEQIAAATDYAANLVAGLRILKSKWNQLQRAGVTINNNDPSKIENWFYATWAYNSGYHTGKGKDDDGVAGLGWLNNPANPRYPPGRTAFGKNPRDFATPSRWPYPEKVLGFASYPPSGYENPELAVPFFRAARWLTDLFREAAVPPPWLFCVQQNSCAWGTSTKPDGEGVEDEPAGPCQHKNAAGKFDLKCWITYPLMSKDDCARTCGFEFIRYPYPEYAQEPDDGISYPPVCTPAGLVADAITVDDVPNETKPVQNPGCNGIGRNYGSFDFTFKKNAQGFEPGKIDLHQLGGGLGSHFWFSHTRGSYQEGLDLEINGTWTFEPIDGLARVKVHIPAHMNKGSLVTYRVENANGTVPVIVDQKSNDNRWVDLGVHPFSKSSPPKIHLGTIQPETNGEKTIAWDAAALEPAYQTGSTTLYQPTVWNDANGRCMMLRNNSTSETVVEQRDCNKFSANYWYFEKVGTEPESNAAISRIIDRGNGRCLQSPDGSTGWGVPVIEATCDSNNLAQLWVVPDLVNTPEPKMIRNRDRGMFITPKDSSYLSGTPLVLEPEKADENGNSTDPSQSWRLSMEAPPS